jgi:3D (Asp-Asp-Asp) domain-containing protein
MNAGPYSGIDTVADTGPAIQGRHIDFVPDPAQAKRFGKKLVRVRVLRWGPAQVAPPAR